jgi:hypothetical protein
MFTYTAQILRQMYFLLATLKFGRSRNLGSIPNRGKTAFSSPKRPERPWDHLNLYSTRMTDPSAGGKDAHLHPMRSLRTACRYAYIPSPICLERAVPGPPGIFTLLCNTTASRVLLNAAMKNRGISHPAEH